jgi:LysR family transcriptional regulator, regulator for bpeEF and oprC
MTETVAPLDLNHLRIFEKVAEVASFSAAARALGAPKSNISRSIAELEAALGTRLFQRTTRSVVLTAAGEALRERCTPLLASLQEALQYVSGLADTPRGHIKVSAGIGFGINVLSELLPEFLERYPEIRITLDLSTRHADLVAQGVDCAVRFGVLADSSLVSTALGSMNRYVCAAAAYLAKHGTPRSPEETESHDTLEMPGIDGRALPWIFRKDGKTVRIDPRPRVLVDEALTIYRLVNNGAGIGIISAYLCAADLKAGRLVRLFPEWVSPPLPVNLVYPSRRELAPAVRAFADFLKESAEQDSSWKGDGLAH